MTKLITPGELAPDFELEDVNGTKVKLSSFRNNKPVVLAFLRGFM
jgi:peroxiredoxin